MRKATFLFVAGWWLALGLLAQVAEAIPAARFKTHISYLASPELEGRMTGTAAELKAVEYLSAEFEKSGAAVTRMPFSFVKEVIPSANAPEHILRFAGENLACSQPTYPITGTGNGIARGRVVDVGYGIEDAAARHNDYEKFSDLTGMIALIDIGLPGEMHAHHPLLAYRNLIRRVRLAEAKGAAGIIFHRRSADDDEPSDRISARSKPGKIPVVYTEEQASALVGKEVVLEVDLKWVEGTGHNVIAFKDNGAEHTLVLGAHFDHIGWGEFGSREKSAVPAIHFGADDNASGTAMLLELARVLNAQGAKRWNYLYLAFSGEEMGLLGSKAFTESEWFKQYSMEAMLNFDMVGRINPAEPVLTINGVGTAPAFRKLSDSLRLDGLKVVGTLSGVGPSDHASFYAKEIPAVHFFTGLHDHYHKPSDTEDKINYAGMELVSRYVLHFINALATSDSLVFTKTAEPSQSRSPFRVSLGVVPDYSWQGKGLRISGTAEGKPAAAAGMQAGDVLVAVGDAEVSDIHAYMNILSAFKPGQKAILVWMRSETRMEAEITW